MEVPHAMASITKAGVLPTNTKCLYKIQQGEKEVGKRKRQTKKDEEREREGEKAEQKSTVTDKIYKQRNRKN